MKHPDLPLMKMSLFAWAILIQSFMIIVAMPTFSAAMIMMYTDRLGVSGFFNPAMGGDPIAYQHLFWFTFHLVYIPSGGLHILVAGNRYGIRNNTQVLAKTYL